MSSDQYPLIGYYKVGDSAGGSATRWGRIFSDDKAYDVNVTWDGGSRFGGYRANGISIEILPTTPGAASWVKGQSCGRGTETQVRPVGDAVKACIAATSDGDRTYDVFSSTRNVGIYSWAWLNLSVSHPGDVDVLETLALLMERQIAILEQLSPPGPAMTVAATPAFQFNTPANLPAAEADKPYRPNVQPFSFCDPPTTGPTMQCPPPGTTARNPSGGSPPYHFRYGTLGGFPPFGMSLGKDGQLTGTPRAATAGKTYRFTVCAVDLKADFVCREVSLSVIGLPPATLTLTPSTAAQGAQVTVTGQGFTPNGGLVSLTLGATSVLAGQPAINAIGAFTTTFTVPASATGGTNIVTARDNAGRSATATLTVTAPPPENRITPSATITSLSCSRITPGYPSSVTYSAPGTVTGNQNDAMQIWLRVGSQTTGTIPLTVEVFTIGWTGSSSKGGATRLAGDTQSTTWTIRGRYDVNSGSTLKLVVQVNGRDVATATCAP